MAALGKNRQFPTAYKLKAIKRVERGEGVLPVARELGISRKILHDWIKAWKAHGPETDLPAGKRFSAQTVPWCRAHRGAAGLDRGRLRPDRIFFIPLLKPKPVLLIFLASLPSDDRGALRGLGIETGTGRVRCHIPILLFGGFGYAHL
ncbi:helix-turn-helix domain-containing protein [Bradyrhizobium sp. 18BD]